MSPSERIAKLEAILARVTTRAASPRETNGGAAGHAPVRALADEPVISSEPITPLDVEVSEAVDEAPAPARPQPPAEALAAESRERIIAAPKVPADAPELDGAPISAEPPISGDGGERTMVERVAPDTSESPEIVVSTSEVVEVSEEEPPASSRRPIAIEPKLEELAFGEAPPAEVVSHTPPPESGRQVAAAPVDLDFDGEFTGVRPREPETAAVTVLDEAARAKAPQPVVHLAPEATAAKLPASVAVSFHGAAPVFKPVSFGELLDATLSL